MRIDGTSVPQQPLVQGGDIADGRPYARGSVLEAEVLANEEGRLTLKMPDGAVVMAKSTRPLPVLTGDILRLTVLGKSKDTLLVEPAGGRSLGGDALRQLGVAINRENLGLAEALLKSSLPVSTRVWDKLTSALSAFPNLAPDTAVFMLEHRIPINKQSIIMMDRMAKQEHKLGNMLSRLENLLTVDEADTAQRMSPAPQRTPEAPRGQTQTQTQGPQLQSRQITEAPPTDSRQALPEPIPQPRVLAQQPQQPQQPQRPQRRRRRQQLLRKHQQPLIQPLRRNQPQRLRRQPQAP